MILAIISLLIVIAITMLITRLAAMALVLTGMSQESARFQARSALAGVGFTTQESEMVMRHPVRRRIIMLLMLVGNISVPTVVAALGVSLFTTFQSEEWWRPLLILVLGLLILYLSGISHSVRKSLNILLTKALKRWTDLDVRDYVSLLQLQSGFAVNEMVVDPGDWLDGKTLLNASLSREGILVLGIQHSDGTYIGSPGGNDAIRAGDTLILYEQIDRLRELDQRKAFSGDSAHKEATAEHSAELKDQTSADSR